MSAPLCDTGATAKEPSAPYCWVERKNAKYAIHDSDALHLEQRVGVCREGTLFVSPGGGIVRVPRPLQCSDEVRCVASSLCLVIKPHLKRQVQPIVPVMVILLLWSPSTGKYVALLLYIGRLSTLFLVAVGECWSCCRKCPITGITAFVPIFQVSLAHGA